MPTLRQQKVTGRYLVWVLSGVLPLVVFAAVMLVLFFRQQEEAIGRLLHEAAQKKAIIVERAVSEQIGLLNGLATDPSLDHGDFETFQVIAERLWALHPEWRTVILTDEHRSLFNLRYAREKTIPPLRDPESLKQVWTTGKPSVGNLSNGFVAIRVPVIRNQQLFYTLVAPVDPGHFSRAIQSVQNESTWDFIIVGSDDVIIAASPQAPVKTGDVLDATPPQHREKPPQFSGLRSTVPVQVGLEKWRLYLLAPSPAVEMPFTLQRLVLVLGGGLALAATLVLVVMLSSAWTAKQESLHLRRTLEERERAEENLRRSEERFATIYRRNPISIAIVRARDDRIMDVNQAWSTLTGYSVQEATGNTPLVLNLWVDIAHRRRFFCALQEVGAAVDEVRIRDKSGEIHEVLMSAEMIELHQEPHYLAIAQDISTLKRANDLIRYQEELMREMGRIAKIGAWEFNPVDGKGTWTDEVARIHDLDPALETSMEIGLSFFQGESRATIEKAVQEACVGAKPYNLELELVSAAGIRKWVRTIGQPRLENGRVVHVRGSFQDITEYKQVEQRVTHLNRVLRTIRDVNHLIRHQRSPDALIQETCRLLVENRGYSSTLVVLLDPAKCFTSWAENDLSEVHDRMVQMLNSGELPPCCLQSQPGGKVILIDKQSHICDRCPRADLFTEMDSLRGRLEHDGLLFGYLVVALESDLARDPEEQNLFGEIVSDLGFALNFIRSESAREESQIKSRQLESQLIQAQKMESVGRLAGGVAHDFNNMLGVISGHAEMALDQPGLDDALRDSLMEILAAARRSTEITRQLLGFARKQTILPKPLNLNDTIEGMLKMIQRLIGEDIALAWHPTSALWPIFMDPAQIDQILMNLCVNARDAIDNVGRLTIETRNQTLDLAYCDLHAGFAPGDYVVLMVSDTGRGMAKETLEKIFEPFFTTKDLGSGTGLGLSTIYGIVKQNQGFINAYSEPGQGATFKIFLPRYVSDALVVKDHKKQARIAAGNAETILIVEDEPSILKLAASMLRSIGYSVLTADTPDGARRLVEAHAGEIALLMTDVIMPEMNGRDLAALLQQFQPRLKCLFMSGYTANVIAHRGILDEGVNFIQKPFARSDLAQKIRAILDA